MSVITEIKIFLDSLGNLGTIVIGNFPASPDVMGCLYERGGSAPDRQFGVAGIKYENVLFQLVFRGVAFDYASPRAKAETAYRALAAVQPGALVTGVSTIYQMITPQQSPFPVAPLDENNRYRIGCNFYVTKELS